MAEGVIKPLAGRGVLVTRPQGQSESLSDLIEAAGGRAIRFPLLEIVPVPLDAEGPRTLADIAGCDWLVFVSSNAVRLGLACIRHAGEPAAWPKVAAIGQATAVELERQGLKVDLAPKQQFNSEALLALPEFADVTGQRILIVRGTGGREVLADILKARGADVTYAEVYRRAAPQVDPSSLLERWSSGEIDVVTVTSGDALDNLEQIVAAGDHSGLLRSTPLAVIGERIAQKARSLGYANVEVAEAGDESLLAAVIALAGNRREVPNHSENGDTALVDEEKEVTLPGEQPDEMTATDAYGESQEARPAPKKSRVGAWVGYLILLLVFALAGGGFFILNELRTKQEGLGSGLDKGDRQMQELLHQISGFQTELAALHSQFATLQSQVTTEDTKFERQIGEQGSTFGERLESTKNELAASIQHIQRQMNKTRGDMMVADAEYLLGIANQKLHLTGDVKAVLAALAAADQRLHDSGDPGVFKVREALAEEINQLEEVKIADVVGLSAQILALESVVRDLPLFLPHTDKGKSKAEAGNGEKALQSPAGENGAAGLLDSALSDFKGLVTVRRTDRPVQAVLVPEEVEALRQVLLLRMEITRLALLRGDDGLYKSSLDSVLSWIKEHFDSEAAATKDLLAELAELKAQQIAIPFPDISKSLTLLRNIEKLRLEAEDRGNAQAQPQPQPAAAPEGTQP
jgi:uroporphyrinogen-III synthase/uncharacterized protein HemX